MELSFQEWQHNSLSQIRSAAQPIFKLSCGLPGIDLARTVGVEQLGLWIATGI